MFLEILPDLLRGSTTTICLLCLFPVLSQPKFKIKTYFVFASCITIADTVACSFFYFRKDYTGVFYYSLVVYILIVIGCKLLFCDKLIQWCFSCVTVLNVYTIVVIASYYLKDLFPYPIYALSIIRIVMFLSTIILFRIFLRPLYLEVSDNWAAFLLPTSGILANYLYIMMSLGDIEVSMSENIVYFCILTLVTTLTYIAIIFSLKSLKQKYAIREENLRRKANEELLTGEIDSYKNFINAAKQTRHDIRHHNAILAEYLNGGDVEGAKEYLKFYDDSIKVGVFKDFSKNPTANAVFRLYDRRTRECNVEFIVHSEIDTEFLCSQADTGILLSNILENALEACGQCDFSEKYIYYTSAIQNGSVLIEIRNSIGVQLNFENGLPVTTKVGGGTGLMSVRNIVHKYNGMLDVRQEDSEFITRIILPASAK